ncbi:tight adherence protein C [Acidocella aminolytica 101 = DSM 11237]|uniref:Secretion system type II protein n=2 Tax=Acidocella TaxID=50709 RepID=A0A0D6PCQ7_9PROT|nr:secretion system type II protein [Acidocella aminolytica 101 = DSM 11237]GBQ36784.1 Flp pilus assembly protein TadC [Acidocella aminolytica 101 = DSM 11237]SHE43747.1 tight adherence protein C [Acidocella aminolytica 101 = DSM 11237]
MFSSSAYIFVGLLAALLALVAIGFALAADIRRTQRMNRRLELAIHGRKAAELEDVKPAGSPVLRAVSAFGMFIARSGLLSRKTLEEMTATLESAGFRGGKGLGLFVGAKILLLFLMPLLLLALLHGFLPGRLGLIVKLGGGAVFGMLLPEIIATNIRKRHLEQVERGVPDALDMLVICADAGLALEAGIARVAQEIQMLNPDLAQELLQTSRELQIGADMRSVLSSLGQRTDLEVLKRLATTLTQSLQFGTPLTQALRSLSAELRAEALVRFEEKAGKLPTLMTLPMIVFILPCVFLIVGGPAIINVLATLSHHH